MITETDTIKILCPFCGVPYTAEMVTQLEHGCREDSFGNADFSSAIATIEITCSHCKKVVYRKEIDN